jgi:hypothetical protein
MSGPIAIIYFGFPTYPKTIRQNMRMNYHVLLCTMMPILGFPHRPMFVPALVYVVWCFVLISKKGHRCKWTWETIIFFMKTQIKVKEQCFIQFFNKTFLSYETCVTHDNKTDTPNTYIWMLTFMTWHRHFNKKKCGS